MRQSRFPLAPASGAVLVAALFAGATLGIASCGQSELELKISADPRTVSIGPGVSSRIVITSEGAALLDGDQIDIETTLGSFREDASDYKTEQVFARGGQAEINLYSNTPGSAAVTATWIPPGGTPVRASVTVNFTHPDVATLHFSCGAQNIGAFINSAESMAIPCDAYAEDENQRPVPSANIKFLAEAGGFDYYDSYDNRSIWTYNPRKGGRQPRDVEPLPGEPSWSPDNGLTIHNPRDGLVTLVAYTDGPAFGLGEPYVDANDNGKWDEGEEFIDVDGDGLYSESQDTVIWKQVKILWTGEVFPPAGATSVAQASTINPPSAFIQRGQQVNFQVTLLDRNLNILAANSPDDAITFRLDGTGGAPVGGVFSRPLHRGFGINIDPLTYQIRNPNSPASYKMNSQYNFEVQNVRNDEPGPGQPPLPPEPYNLYGEIYRSYSIDPDGFPRGYISSETTPTATGQFP